MSFITREHTEKMGNTFAWYYADHLRAGKDEIGTEHFLAALLSTDPNVTDFWWEETGIPRDFLRSRFGVSVEDQIVDGREESEEQVSKKTKTINPNTKAREYTTPKEKAFFPVSDALLRALEWEAYLFPANESQKYGYQNFIQAILLADERDAWQELLLIPQIGKDRRDMQSHIDKRIIGLAALNQHDWIYERKQEVENRGAVVLWWAKMPTSRLSVRQKQESEKPTKKGVPPQIVDETLRSLDDELNRKGYFEVFYVRNNRVKFRAVIRAHATQESYERVMSEWQARNQAAHIPTSLDAFRDNENPNADPRFLMYCTQIDELEPDLPASAIRYPEGVGEVIQNNLQPVAGIQTHFPSESAKLETFVNERVKGVIGVENQAEEVAGIIRTLDARRERGAMLGIFGRWGRGKTFLWQQVQAMLESVKVKGRRLRYEQQVLELMDGSEQEEARKALQQSLDDRLAVLNRQKARFGDAEVKMHVVEFHAWKYQDTEAAWAYLYECMAGKYYSLPVPRKALNNGPHEVERAFDESHVAWWEKLKRYGRHMMFKRRVLRASELPLPYVITNAALRCLRFFGLIVLFKKVKLNYVKNGILPILGFVAFVGLNAWAVYYLGTKEYMEDFDASNIEAWFSQHRVFSLVLSSLSVLIGLGGAVQFQKDVRSKALTLFKKYTSSTSFDRLLGVQAEIQKELNVLLRAWIPDRRVGQERVLIFVDDLDRCREEKIVEIIDALKVMLEDEEVSKRVVVLAAIDERVLMRAISGKYTTQIERDKNLRSEHERKQRINRLAREYIDKLFIGGINLGSLAEHEKMEVFKAFTLHREVVRFQQARNEGGDTDREKEAVDEQQENQSNREEAVPVTQESTAVPGITPVIKAGDHRFEIEEFEYKMLYPYLHIFVELTPRSIRIYYYRYLLARQLMSHRLREDAAFHREWNSDFPHRELLPFLILKFTHDGEVDEIAKLKDAILRFSRVGTDPAEKICLFWVFTRVYGNAVNHPDEEPPALEEPEKEFTPDQLCEKFRESNNTVWFGDIVVRPGERPLMCRKVSARMLITILEMVETVVPY